jgi:NADH-quinone oxidoreductase subunit D/NADH-quinone oxidoreductase subunit C/D
MISAENAIRFSMTGPVLRAAGVPYDIRRADPYSIYDRFDFEVAVRPNGDLFDNYIIRIDEIRQSLRILEQALRQIPAGPINTQKPQYQVRVAAGEAYGRIESPKGELGFYVVSNGKPNPWRYHVRAPSFVNITALEQICIGKKIADFVAMFGVIDVVMGELDR